MALLWNIIASYTSIYEEETEKKEWKDAMIEEYNLIIKNDVWDVVLRPEGKYVVFSKWIYKIKHVVGVIIDKHK